MHRRCVCTQKAKLRYPNFLHCSLNIFALHPRHVKNLTGLAAYYINTLFCTCLGTSQNNKLPWMLLHAGVMILALVCSVLGLCAWVVALVGFLLPCSPMSFHKLLKCAHVWMGDSILILRIGSYISGINQKLFLPYANLPPEALVANSLGVLIVAFGLAVLKMFSNQKWKRPEPTSEDMSYRVSATNLMSCCQVGCPDQYI
uniref:Lysosomal membrane ascorbate-dependent ferrireductase CYB561A3 n=1 Tax=Oncorhynchus mykiss TaxID=8022 RepID=A0A8K9V5G9_ONCMY